MIYVYQTAAADLLIASAFIDHASRVYVVGHSSPGVSGCVCNSFKYNVSGPFSFEKNVNVMKWYKKKGFRGGCSFNKRMELTDGMSVQITIQCSLPNAIVAQFSAEIMPSTPQTPAHELVALSEFRNSQDTLREWITYHAMIGFNHFFLYNDASNDASLEVLIDFVKQGYVTVKDWSQFRDDPMRQFLAMEDFLFRYSKTAKIVAQFDDDCFYVARKNGTPSSAELKPMLRLFFEDRKVSQLEVWSHFFGASGLREKPSTPTPFAFFRRSQHVGRFVPWPNFATGKNVTIAAFLAFARSEDIIQGNGMTHNWQVRGRTANVAMTNLSWNHYKVKTLSEYMKRDRTGGAWGGSSGWAASSLDHWKKLDKLVSDVEDKSLLILESTYTDFVRNGVLRHNRT